MCAWTYAKWRIAMCAPTYPRVLVVKGTNVCENVSVSHQMSSCLDDSMTTVLANSQFTRTRPCWSSGEQWCQTKTRPHEGRKGRNRQERVRRWAPEPRHARVSASRQNDKTRQRDLWRKRSECGTTSQVNDGSNRVVLGKQIHKSWL